MKKANDSTHKYARYYLEKLPISNRDKGEVRKILDKIKGSIFIQIKSIDFEMVRKKYPSLLTHIIEVVVVSILIGIKLGFKEDRLYDLAVGAIVHDTGKLYIPKEILNKPAKLTEEEFKIMQTHSKVGYEAVVEDHIISNGIEDIILQHHEKIDGTGYPNGLQNGEISKLARIVSIADVFSALTSRRIYREAWGIEKAITYMYHNTGNHFDKEIMKEFIDSLSNR